MKPLLKPNKGWKYRVIVCDEEGNYEHDDVSHIAHIAPMACKLAALLPNLKRGINAS